MRRLRALPDLLEHTRHYIRQSAPTALLDLFGPDRTATLGSVHDCYALGRADPRAFILLRRSLLSLDGEPLIQAIVILSYVAGHPDVLWHNSNWIAESICAQVRPTFRWSANEVHRLLTAVEARIREEYGGWVRGGLGQSLWHLLGPNPNLTTAATEVIGMSLLADDLDIAFRALTLAQGRADDLRATVAEIMARYPELASHELAKA